MSTGQGSGTRQGSGTATGGVRRRYVVSDVHGHLADLRSVLRREGLLDAEDGWADRGAELWVLGDLLDRGPDGIGVVRLLRRLTTAAPDHVHVLLGNHEVLALGAHRWPDGPFGGSWRVNGGRVSDQAGLTEEDLAWMRRLPVLAVVGDHLLAHTDTDRYAEWGEDLDTVNAHVAAELAADDQARAWEVWSLMCDRFAFARGDGARRAERVLAAYGGDRLVHGHTVVGSLAHVPSTEVTVPLLYAEGRVLAVDGGRYDGGPLLLVRLD